MRNATVGVAGSTGKGKTPGKKRKGPVHNQVMSRQCCLKGLTQATANVLMMRAQEPPKATNLLPSMQCALGTSVPTPCEDGGARKPL